jgi:hypothetical protein
LAEKGQQILSMPNVYDLLKAKAEEAEMVQLNIKYKKALNDKISYRPNELLSL